MSQLHTKEAENISKRMFLKVHCLNATLSHQICAKGEMSVCFYSESESESDDENEEEDNESTEINDSESNPGD